MDEYGKHNHPHTHEHYSLGALVDHLRGWHKDEEDLYELDEEHDHASKQKVNWNHAANIDVNPLAMKTLRDASVVYFGIEGCLKADSILSAIRREGMEGRWSVISVPAVGMWDCPELDTVIDMYLKNKTVIIVPDADWRKTPQVGHQARVLQGRLESHCTKVHVAAPPFAENGDMRKAFNQRKGEWEYLKGVDDFLGLGGGSLLELDCIDRERPTDEDIAIWALENGVNITPYITTIIRLSLMTDDGMVSTPYRTMGKIIGVPFTTMASRIHALEKAGALKIHGNLTTKWGRWGEDWENRPTIEIHPQLRSTPLPPRPLGTVLGG